jgi:hypothetical protein
VTLQGIAEGTEWAIDYLNKENGNQNWQKLAVRIGMVAMNFILLGYTGVWHHLAFGGLLQAALIFLSREICWEQERVADEKAMQVLNSNQGGVAFFHHSLKTNYKIKHTPAEEYQKLHRDLSLEDVKGLQSNISIHGNNCRDFTHPPLTERLKAALNFKPLAAHA